MIEHDPIRDHYFGILRAVVADLTARGRQAHAAGLKPKLRELTNGSFNENQLGYPTFRAFLEGAQQAGYVRLRETAFDIEALPLIPGDQEAAPPPSTSVRPGVQIRPDFWRAWIRWDDALERYYDTRDDRVILFQRGSDGEHDPTSPDGVLRSAVAASPDRYVQIEPVSREETLQAMRDFAQGWENEGEREAMQAVLDTPDPAAAALAFTRLVKASPSLSAGWHMSRLRQVSDAIKEWTEARGLNVTYLRDSRRPPTRPKPAEERHPALPPREAADLILRERVKRAVDRMPMGELLRLSIPIEYMVED